MVVMMDAATSPLNLFLNYQCNDLMFLATFQPNQTSDLGNKLRNQFSRWPLLLPYPYWLY